MEVFWLSSIIANMNIAGLNRDHRYVVITIPLQKSHILPTCEPRVFHMGTHVFHIKAHIFQFFSQNVINCPL